MERMATDVNAAINLRLALLGLPLSDDAEGAEEVLLVAPILARQRELTRRLANRPCAADQRIQSFLDDYLADTSVQPVLPTDTLVLDQPGLARGLSLPVIGDHFQSPLINSYRCHNGVLHNPASDRRTTKGVFHIAEGGLPIPDDKIAVSKQTFALLLARALDAPDWELTLPFTSNEADGAGCWVSLLLRPVVVPEVPGRTTRKTMETRFIAPGGLVANLDFVEGIFGNGGDPYLPENDASLDPERWTGHTGCVILAPHLTSCTKKELGLPHYDDASERQRRDSQCWRTDDELYNDGQAFKVCARDERGVIVTIIADNYFGYCKKEVKTQISYSANLLGGAEEEHSGGAQVFVAENLGAEYVDNRTPEGYELADVVARDPQRFKLQPQGFAVDLTNPNHILVPRKTKFSLRTRTVTWGEGDNAQTIKLLAGKTYFLPAGLCITVRQHTGDPLLWELTGIAPESTQCHKPATVSGGGKSEISKSLTDAIVFGNAYSPDFTADIEAVQALLDHDYSNRFADPTRNGIDHRPVLSDDRSLGSVIKLLTPSPDFSNEYNDFLNGLPPHVKDLAFNVKQYYRPEWGGDWRSHFSVGIMNGRLGNMVRLDGEKIHINMLRVGFREDGSWRLFSLRNDFRPAVKVQTEDDITAATLYPDETAGRSRKYVENCERLLFQRPDDAVHRGYDHQAELDLSGENVFMSNFEPLTRADAIDMREDAQGYSQFTRPVQALIDRAAEHHNQTDPDYFVCSAMPRMVDGKPSKNPRYLQLRPDIADPGTTDLAALATHLLHRVPTGRPITLPVDVMAAGRRNNPPEAGIPPLCAYNPLHYMDLPELFMEFISSMTGTSPSTTGAGSEGALTKGPFNALAATVDLNANFLSYALGNYDGWLSSTGYIGPRMRIDHDFSLLVPELFARMSPARRDARALIEGGYLDRIEDFEHEGRTVEASRLGYRMNQRFAITYFGRIFLHPDVVFTDEMLKPELQDPGVYADSVDVIVKTHRRVAEAYLRDGSLELAVPPIRGLLEIMARGRTSDGLTLQDPAFRQQFSRASVLASDWYQARLDAKQAHDVRHVQRGIENLQAFMAAPVNVKAVARMQMDTRLARACERLTQVQSADYRASLVGTIGRQVTYR